MANEDVIKQVQERQAASRTAEERIGEALNRASRPIEDAGADPEASPPPQRPNEGDLPPLPEAEDTQGRARDEKGRWLADEPPEAGEPSDEGGSLDAGDDPDAMPPSDGAAPPQIDLSDFEYEGQTYKVPKPLVDGALRQQDYTRKTEDVARERDYIAAQRKSFEVDQHIHATLADPVARLHNLDAQIQAARDQRPDLSAGLEARYMFDSQLQELRDARDELDRAIQAQRTELLQQKQAADAEILRTGNELLSKRIPNWGPELQKEIAGVLRDIGYSPQELGSFSDTRPILLAYEAMRSRRMKQNEATVRKKVATADPVVRPSGSTPNAQSSAKKVAEQWKQQARKTGKQADAENALLALMRANRRK